MRDSRDRIITDGTAQKDRYSPALAADYFHVDELGFEALLAMGAEFASVINFFNLKNETDGHWGALFNADEAVIMAMILCTDLPRLELDFLKISPKSPDSLARFILSLAIKINFWFTQLKSSQHKSAEALAQKLATIINEKLVAELHTVGEIASYSQRHPSPDELVDFTAFDHIWCLGKPNSGDLFPNARPRKYENSTHIKQQLRSSFNIFLHSISYLKTITPLFFQQSLWSQQHNPAIGLFMVFLKLYEKAQQNLNTFTQRHLDFYYNQVLKVTNRKPVSESVYLLFETQAGTTATSININTEFSPGKDAQLNQIIYCADEDRVVTDAKVRSLATLHMQHDTLISPESDLGYVSRIKSATPTLFEPDINEDQLTAWPLFGAVKQGGNKSTSTDTRIGFYLASSILLLKDGVRKIEVEIELGNVVNIDVKTMVFNLLNSKTNKVFIPLFGRLFARYLLTFKGCLSDYQKNQIITKVRTLRSTILVAEIESLLIQDWQGLFYRLFKKIFCIKLTTETGWLGVDDYIVRPYSQDVEQKKLGLRISLSLGQQAEPIAPYIADVHGSELATKLPVLQCYINPQTNFYPYSVFQDLVIHSLQIDVDVKGVKNILAYNQHGQLDPSKPFQPFGPLPTCNSYFVIGNYEIARKRLVNLKVNLEWGELPRHRGGFGEYYRDYPTRYDNSMFKGTFTALSDSNWQPDDMATQPYVCLFDNAAEGMRVSIKKSMTVNVIEYSKPIDESLSEAAFQYSLTTRNGFFRLLLAGPESAFGHAVYPKLLTQVLSENARLKKPKQIPNSPYTPTLNKMSLDYKASARINLAGTDDVISLEKIIHMHPFGVETVYPADRNNPCYFMPQYTHEDYLFIGISAKNIAGNLSLFFHLSKELSQGASTVKPAITWSYLASNTWKSMSVQQVVSDTTLGFITSGIVTLNIPEDISRNNSVMPGEYFWLSVSTAQDACAFDRIYFVTPHALKVSRKINADVAANYQLPRMVKWTSVVTIPGIGSIRQAENSFGGRLEESDRVFKARISERLRHKNRALVPWDYERLILERFPDIFKVKCFSTISSIENSLKPGHVLIVVLPNLRSYAGEACVKEVMDTEQLNQIKMYVKNLSSPFVSIEVRNPVYEQIQVRCTVKFTDKNCDGVNINRLNQEISDYICPRQKRDDKARFGWQISQKDIESFIRSLNYVDFVTNFSMLHITVGNDGQYRLFDTAKEAKNNEVVIKPRYPWSLAIAIKKHFIETVQVVSDIKAELTGVNELEVGSTFIISGNNEYGEEE